MTTNEKRTFITITITIQQYNTEIQYSNTIFLFKRNTLKCHISANMNIHSLIPCTKL